jgi:hypothetical protein
MYKISSREVPFMGDSLSGDQEFCKGIIVSIEPPIDLNPVGIERYLNYQDLSGVDPGGSYDKFDIILLGSTDKETSIYASSDKVEQIAMDIKHNVAEYIGFMGAQTVIEPLND